MVVAVLLFAASRLYLLLAFTPAESDISWVYETYALEHAQAVSQGRPLYPFHAAQFKRARVQALASGLPAPVEESQWIEYPPLALALVQLPKAFIRPVIAPPLDDWPPHAAEIPGYASTFRRVMASVDAIGFGALLWLVPGLYPRENGRGHLERWLSYIVGGHVLGHLLYDRLSLPAGVLLLLAVGLLALPRVPVLLGLAALAIGINYQLSPVVLAPVIVLGSLPSRALPDGTWLNPAVSRALLAAALTLGLFAAFYAYQGPNSLGLFRFHANRGVQVEAVSSSLPLVMSFFGYPIGTFGEYNSCSLACSLSPILKNVSAPMVAGGVLAVAAAFAVLLRRGSRLPERGRIAQVVAPAFAGFAGASLTVAIIGSKVFSPQYLCWLLPMVPLLPRRRYTQWLFVIVAALTTIIFPYAYTHVTDGPTTLGKLLLLARNALLVTFAAVTAHAAWRSARTSGYFPGNSSSSSSSK